MHADDAPQGVNFARRNTGKSSNDNAELVDFLRRVRPMTKVRGNPAVIVSAHPVKNAGDDNLVPYGAGAILNEVDGNFTLVRHSKRVEMHWQGKLRGLDFHPLSFQIETVCTPDVLDSKRRQIPLPVMLPVAAQSDEDKEKAEKSVHKTSRKLLLAMLDKPDATQTEWSKATDVGKASVSIWLKKLKTAKLVDDTLGWKVTPKGEKAVGWKPGEGVHFG